MDLQNVLSRVNVLKTFKLELGLFILPYSHTDTKPTVLIVGYLGQSRPGPVMKR